MFEVKEIKKTYIEKKKVYGIFYASTKEIVTDDAEIDGMPAGYSVAEGSWLYTKNGEIAIYDNGWNWVDKTA